MLYSDQYMLTPSGPLAQLVIHTDPYMRPKVEVYVESYIVQLILCI